MEVYPEKTIYRYLGRSGLRVSVMGYGNYLNADTEEEEQ
jgi:voltage-dependent potassium channel beta subunit